jgi:hypothetical protein
VSVHAFQKRPSGGGGCKQCGYTRSNEEQHGHSCTGRVIFDAGSATKMHCYGCGKAYTFGGSVTVSWR